MTALIEAAARLLVYGKVGERSIEKKRTRRQRRSECVYGDRGGRRHRDGRIGRGIRKHTCVNTKWKEAQVTQAQQMRTNETTGNYDMGGHGGGGRIEIERRRRQAKTNETTTMEKSKKQSQFRPILAAMHHLRFFFSFCFCQFSVSVQATPDDKNANTR